MEFYRDKLFNEHWGEQMRFTPENTLEISMVCQGFTRDQVRQIWQPFFDWVKSSKDLTANGLIAVAGHARSWWEIEGNPAMNRDERLGAPTSTSELAALHRKRLPQRTTLRLVPR